jgi:type II secretory pathway pseudopilin PulG
MSLIELLVVIGILVVVLALLLPAIQKVRETANKMVCASQLRQLGVAAHHYHKDHGVLPPGYLGPAVANPGAFYQQGQALGHLPLLLPYLEQDRAQIGLNVSCNVHVVAPLPWFRLPGPVPNDTNYTIAQQQFKLLLCPSAVDYTPMVGNPNPGGGGTVTGLHVYHDKNGIYTVGWRDPYTTAAKYCFLGRTHYVGVAGCGTGTHPLYRQYEGIYTNRSQVSLGLLAVQDGTSNTLLYGETVGSQWDGSPAETLDLSWMGAGGLGTYLGTLRGRGAPLIAFSSYHPGGVPFCFADTSVRTVRFITPVDGSGNYTPEWFLLQQLAGRNDGKNADTSAILD